jgi:autotransporter translocation and assembly factor TamB
LALPSDIALPVAWHLDLSVGRIAVQRGLDTHEVSQLRARYNFAGGTAQHLLTVEELRYGELAANARLALNMVGTWPVEATVEARSSTSIVSPHVASQQLEAQVSLSGHLGGAQRNEAIAPARLNVSASAQANTRQLLRAQAVILPWAVQPLNSVTVTLQQFDITRWMPLGSGVPSTDLSGHFALTPGTGDSWSAELQLSQAPSQNLPPAQASAHITLSADRLHVSKLDITLGKSGTSVGGSSVGGSSVGGSAWLQGDVSLDLSSKQVQATLTGGAPGLALNTELNANTKLHSLPIGQLSVQVSDIHRLVSWVNQLGQRTQLIAPLPVLSSGKLDFKASFNGSGQVQATLNAQQLSMSDGLNNGHNTWALQQARVVISNTWQDLNVNLMAQTDIPGMARDVRLSANARLNIPTKQPSDMGWSDLSWQLDWRDKAAHSWLVRSSSPWSGQLRAGIASGNASGVSLGLQNCDEAHCLSRINWQAWTASASGVVISGTLANLNTAAFETLLPDQARTWRSNVVVGGTWRARFGPQKLTDIALSLATTNGDIEVVTPNTGHWQAIGLDKLAVQAHWLGTQLQANAALSSDLIGHASAHLTTSLKPLGWGVQATPNAPVKASATLDLNELIWLSPWLPSTLQIGGKLLANVQLGGTHSQPLPSASLTGSDLSLKHTYGDFDVGGGQLQAQLDPQGVDIERLYMHGVVDQVQGGYAIATGRLNWDQGARNTTPSTSHLALELKGFQAASKADRRVRISGELLSQWQLQRLNLSGSLTVDKADITLGKMNAPNLGDDVVIRGNAAIPPANSLPLNLDINLSLGDAFKVSGFGLRTGLRGALHIGGPDAFNQPQLNGEVNTVDARYKAYGQDLLVKRGRLLFAGRPDTPQIDLLAVRAMTEPEVGIQVQGSLKNPKVTLYANVAMADSDKLSWLLLGHPSARGGSEAAVIQNAIVGLVGDNQGFADVVDEFSIEGESRQTDGSTRAAQLTVGKQLGERIYTSYTRSVASIQGLLSIHLKLSNSLSVRAQTGEANNIDLVWSRAYD